MVCVDNVWRAIITLLTLYLIVIRNKIRNKFPCSLVVLLLSFGWHKEQRRCSLAAFPSTLLIIFDLRQRTMMFEEGKIFAGFLVLFSSQEEVAALLAPWHR